MMRCLFTILLVVGITAASAHAQTTYYVNTACGNDDWSGLDPVCEEPDGPKATIQAGINAAQDGDTVQVADGVYKGEGNKNIDFLGNAITVRSENGAENCIIDCEGDGRGFYFRRGEKRASALEAFTITHGSVDSGGGIYCRGSSPRIINCIITRNTATYRGGGIVCDYGSDARITNCTIARNTARYGGGISCDTSAKITDCTIVENTARWGGGINADGGVDGPLVTHCTIARNTGDYGGGVYCFKSHGTIIADCLITGNTAERYGGGVGLDISRTTITDCTITANTAYYYGGAIHCDTSSNPTIRNCTIADNTTARGGGGGITADSNSSPTIVDCTITGNTGRSGGGIYSMRDSNLIITNCIIIGNQASSPDFGGAGICIASSSAAITNCTIAGNAASRFGGGVLCYQGNAVIMNCTITGNTAKDSGGALYAINDSKVTITDSILWTNSPEEIHIEDSVLMVRYSDVQGGWEGEGNIDTEPLFVEGPLGEFYLSQIAAGQKEDSPCVDAGSDTAKNLGLDEYTTRTDEVGDEGVVDMGYHHPIREGGFECGEIKRLKAKCKGKPGKFKIKVIVKSNLPQGTEMTLVLDGEDRKTVKTKGNGKAKAKWKKIEPGDHEVCIEECPEVCDDARCG